MTEDDTRVAYQYGLVTDLHFWEGQNDPVVCQKVHLVAQFHPVPKIVFHYQHQMQHFPTFKRSSKEGKLSHIINLD